MLNINSAKYGISEGYKQEKSWKMRLPGIVVSIFRWPLLPQDANLFAVVCTLQHAQPIHMRTLLTQDLLPRLSKSPLSPYLTLSPCVSLSRAVVVFKLLLGCNTEVA